MLYRSLHDRIELTQEYLARMEKGVYEVIPLEKGKDEDSRAGAELLLGGLCMPSWLKGGPGSSGVEAVLKCCLHSCLSCPSKLALWILALSTCLHSCSLFSPASENLGLDRGGDKVRLSKF